MNGLEQGFTQKDKNLLAESTKRWFQKLVQQEQYVGEVYSISYETALVQIHDHHRQEVGGIPSLCFLVATRITPGTEEIDYRLEDTSFILLRVMDAAPLPDSDEAERIRVQSAQQVSGEANTHWDSQVAMDLQTHHLLSYAGVECRIIGTFFLDRDSHNPEAPLVLRFGSDISNYYPNKGLKVFKPNGDALKEIVNYQDPDRRADLRSKSRVSIGEVRYASTNRLFQGIADVEVSISPADLLGQKTALFGMTRTGKSNTTKIIAKSVFDLRHEKQPLRIGQIIFDPDGEYANENVQDKNNQKNPSALKNVWWANPRAYFTSSEYQQFLKKYSKLEQALGPIIQQQGDLTVIDLNKITGIHRFQLGEECIEEIGDHVDVVTYGVLPHPNDPKRKLMLINFFDEGMLQIGKEIINNVLAGDQSKYIQNFCQVKFEKPDDKDYSALTC